MTESISPTSNQSPNPVKPPREFAFKKNHLWWQITALLAISFFSVYASGAFDQEFSKLVPEKSVLVSTFNKRQSGLSGLFELLERLDLKPKRWYHPYRQLGDFRGCLIITSPLQSLKDYEVKQILKWVNEGNDLVYLDEFNLLQSRILPSQLDVSVKTSVKRLNNESVPVENGPNWLSDLSPIKVSANSRLMGGEAIASDKSGPVLTMIKHGKGRVILGTAPRMVSNDLISDSAHWSNFQLLVNWLQAFEEKKDSKSIYFDERVHGFTGGKNVFVYLSRGPAGFVSMQILLILFIAFISSAQRFGAPVKVDEARRISNMDFIDGLANAYKRAHANASVLEILFHAFRLKLSKMMGVSPHEKDQVLIEAWKNKPPTSEVKLDELMKEYNTAVSNRNLSDQELQNLIATCDKITDTENAGDLEIQPYAKSS